MEISDTVLDALDVLSLMVLLPIALGMLACVASIVLYGIIWVLAVYLSRVQGNDALIGELRHPSMMYIDMDDSPHTDPFFAPFDIVMRGIVRMIVVLGFPCLLYVYARWKGVL